MVVFKLQKQCGCRIKRKPFSHFEAISLTFLYKKGHHKYFLTVRCGGNRLSDYLCLLKIFWQNLKIGCNLGVSLWFSVLMCLVLSVKNVQEQHNVVCVNNFPVLREGLASFLLSVLCNR